MVTFYLINAFLLFLISLFQTGVQSLATSTINYNNLMLFYPRIVSKFESSLITYDLLQIKGTNITIVITYNGYIQIVDFQDFNKPKLISQIYISPVINDLKLSQDQQFLSLSCVKEGLKIYNISQLEKIQFVSQFSKTGWNVQSHYFFKQENQTKALDINEQYVALGIDGNFAILNITNISAPIILSNLITGGVQNLHIQITNDQRFAILSERTLGLVFIDVLDKKNPVFAGRLKFINKVYYIIIHPIKPSVCTYVSFTGLYCLDFSPFYQKPYPLSMANMSQIEFMFASSLRRLTISQDGNFIFLGIREKGIQVVDFRDPPRIYTLHFIQSNQQLYLAAVRLSFDQQFMYIINTAGIVIFKRIEKPNLNKDSPNLHHYYNSYKIPTPWLTSAGYRFSQSNDGKLIFVGQQQAGWNIFNVSDPNNITLLYKSPTSSNIFVDQVNQSPSQPQYLYVSCQVKGLQIYDISNPQIPQLLSTTLATNKATTSMALELKSDPNILIVMCLFEGIQIYNVSDKSKPTVLKIFPTTGQMRDMIITKDEKTLFSTNRDYGLITWDISNISNIQVLNTIINSSPEIMKFSQDYQYLFLADGQRGFTIYNSSIPQNLKQISNLWIGSWGIEVLLTQNDNYAIICTWATQPNIMLINIVNKAHPILIQTFGAYELSTSIILINDEKTLLINSQPFEITVLPLVIPQAILTVIYKQGSNEVYLTGQPLLVGYNVEVHISSLGYTTQKQVTGVTHYAQNQLMPQQMKITCGERLQSCYIQFVIEKDFEGPNYLEINNIMQLEVSDLLDPSLEINETLAVQIIQFLQRNKLLDLEQFPTSNVNTLMDIQSLILMQQSNWLHLVEKIRSVLMNKVYIFSSNFFVQPSLIYNPKANESLHEIIIQSTSHLQILIDLAIDNSNQAQWYNKPFAGVIIFYSENDTKLQISAHLEQLNQLIRLIKVTNYQEPESVMIRIKINDQINYPIEFYSSLAQIPYLKINQAVRPNFSLETQFKTKFNNKNQIYIQEDSTFQFSTDTFIDDDVLTYTALLLVDDNYIPIPRESCIQFSPSERIFTFTPKYQQFLEHIDIKLIASDGYTQASDNLLIHIDLVPFTYMVQIIMIFGGPLVGLIGLLKYRVQIYNIIYKKSFTYSKDIILVGENYEKQIPFILQLWRESTSLLNHLMVKIKTERKTLKHFQTLDTGLLNLEILFSILIQIVKDLSDKQVEDQNDVENQNQGNQGTVQKTKSSTGSTFKPNKKQQTRKQEFKRNKLKQNTELRSPREQMYHKQQSSIDPTLVRLTDNQLVSLKDIQDQESGLRLIIISRLYRQMLLNDKNSKKFYNIFKYNSQFYGEFSSKDWYKAYVKIVAQKEKSNLKKPFPIIEFKQKQILNSLIKSYNQCFTNNIIKQEEMDPNLFKNENPFYQLIYKKTLHPKLQQMFPLIQIGIIIYNLFGDALGLNDNIFLEYASGESLNCSALEVYQCNAYKKSLIQSKCLACCLQFFNYDYIKQEVSNHRSLPPWLKCSIELGGFIYLQGVPKQEDIGEFLIRLEKIDQTIMKQFIIVVQQDAQHQYKTENLKKSNIEWIQDSEIGTKVKKVISFNDKEIDEAQSDFSMRQNEQNNQNNSNINNSNQQSFQIFMNNMSKVDEIKSEDFSQNEIMESPCKQTIK